MTGRTYAIGRETDLEEGLIHKPKRWALHPDWPWAVWYPLRRKPELELLTRQEQGKILMEHAVLGMKYGEADLAHDIRLACHGLDPHDNEFVLGLVGKDLYPLSKLVQDMRKSQQTAKYIQSLGPFFVGKVLCLNKNQICFGPPAEVLTPLELEKLYGGKKKFYHHIHETHGNN